MYMTENGHAHGQYTVVYTGRVHGPCTRAVCTVLARSCTPADTARTRPYTRHATRPYGRIHGRFPPCKQPPHGRATRPCTRPVYTYTRIHMYTYTRVHGPYTALNTTGTRPCIGRVQVPCTRPCTRHVHGRRRPCTRPIQSRDHGRCTWADMARTRHGPYTAVYVPSTRSKTCTWPVYAIV